MRDMVVRMLCLLVGGIVLSGCGGASMYDPLADPEVQLNAALDSTGGTKPVLMQVGGDWCSWCRKFNGLIAGDAELSGQMRENFVWIHIYYARGDQNKAFLQRYVPDGVRMSFPCFILVDYLGNFIGYYESAGLEDGSGYDRARVSAFLTKLRGDYEVHDEELMERYRNEQMSGDSVALLEVEGAEEMAGE